MQRPPTSSFLCEQELDMAEIVPMPEKDGPADANQRGKVFPSLPRRIPAVLAATASRPEIADCMGGA